MNKIYTAFAVLFFTIMSVGNALAATSPIVAYRLGDSLIELNKTTVQSVRLCTKRCGKGTNGMEVSLQPETALQLSQLTANNIGKKINLMYGDEVISSTTIQSRIGAEFLVMLKSKQQALTLIKAIQQN